MGDERFVERADPEEMFAALSEDIRVDVLQALWQSDETPLTFTALRRAVGVADSGQFNYHLERLLGQFVTKTEEGYCLTQAGKQINATIATGAYTLEATFDPITLEQGCMTCGGTRTLSYDSEAISIDCDSCPVGFGGVVPPAVFADAERTELPRIASDFLRTTFQHIANGFCWFCKGPIEPTVARATEIFDSENITAEVSDTFLAEHEDVPAVRFDCHRCSGTSTAGLDLLLLEHPAVTSFYFNRGIDVSEVLLWDLPAMDPDRFTITNDDPFRARTRWRAADDELIVVVDQQLEVLESSVYRGSG